MRRNTKESRRVSPDSGLIDLVLGGLSVRVVRAICRLTGRSDVSYLSPNFAVGGRPNRGAIVRERFDSVLDLTSEAGLGPSDNYEYMKIKIANGRAPTLPQILAMVEWIDGRIKGGGRVLVHCSLGRGRAPFVAACYLMLTRNLTALEALKTVRSRRMYTCLNESQALSLMQFEHHLREKAIAPA